LVAGSEAFINASPAIFATADLYDPSAGTWTKTGSMSVARQQQTATLLPNGQVRVAGGYSQNNVGKFTINNTAEIYTP
jgi:N-acetylneuraminic acid mutarotase